VDERRFGFGFDSHPRDEARPLFLAGVRFEDSEPGLAGHSDADVVCHAVADGLLGAVALGDLGDHFPEDDPAFEGIEGLQLLGRVVELLAKEGMAPESCDATVIAERPRLAEHREGMRHNLAEALQIDVSRVSVKATRPEGLGLAGDGAGCMALVVVRPES
jgi:2-C-methyl-D-erythritol 2,4-cyclodiphosphate synthase